MKAGVSLRRCVATTAIACGLACAAVAIGQPAPLSRRASAALIAKADGLSRNAIAPRPVAQRVPITETELNSFLAFDARPLMPAGVSDARLSLQEGGRVAGQAVVDLDAVRRHYGSGKWSDPLSYLGGRLPVAAVGLFTATGGVARLSLESAHVAGVWVPKAVLQQIVSYYTTSAEYREGVNLDAPFPLPARVRSIEVGRGVAVVQQ